MNSLSISPAEAAQELLKRRNARRDLLAFIVYCNPDYIVSDFSRGVCAELMQFLEDVKAGKRPVIIFSAPPQHGKTEIVSRYLPAFIHGNNSETAIAGISYAADIAQDMGRDVQKIIGSDEYKILFPLTVLGGKNKGVAVKQNQTAYEVGKKGVYRGVGVGGALTSRRVDIGIIDDPIKNSQEALSKTIKDKIWNWYATTFLTRLSKKSGHIIMATRWAVDDLSGRVIENNENVKVLSFPAICENGNALVPELHPIEKLEDMRKTMSAFFWSAIFQQNPIPSDGLFFKPDFIETIDATPNNLQFVRAWDFAGTANGGDYTVGIKIGYDIATKTAYIVDVVRGQYAPEDVERVLLATAQSDGRAVRILIPQDPAQAGKYQAKNFVKILSGFSVIADRVTGSKETRASPVAAQANIGNIKMLRGAWNRLFIEELRLFPNGVNDDQVDAFSDAYNHFINKKSYSF